MKIAKHIPLYALVFLLMAGASFATDIGTYRIPEQVSFAGKTIEPGSYLIQIVEGQDGTYLQLSKGGEVVQKDLAIVIPARSKVGRPQVEIARIANQEFLRIRIRSGENYYYAYMERSK